MSDDLTARQAADLTTSTIAANAVATVERLGPLLQECFAQIRAAIAGELFVAEIELGRRTTPADQLALTRALQQRGFTAEIRTEERQSVDVPVLLVGWKPTRTPRGHDVPQGGGTHLMETAAPPGLRPTPFAGTTDQPPTSPTDDAPGSGPP